MVFSCFETTRLILSCVPSSLNVFFKFLSVVFRVLLWSGTGLLQQVVHHATHHLPGPASEHLHGHLRDRHICLHPEPYLLLLLHQVKGKRNVAKNETCGKKSGMKSRSEKLKTGTRSWWSQWTSLIVQVRPWFIFMLAARNCLISIPVCSAHFFFTESCRLDLVVGSDQGQITIPPLMNRVCLWVNWDHFL